MCAPTSGPLKLLVIGAGFSTFSVVRWNGADRPTRLISTTTLEASIAASDLAGCGHGTGQRPYAWPRWRHDERARIHDRSNGDADRRAHPPSRRAAP